MSRERARRSQICVLLQPCVLLSPFCRNVLLGELPRLTLQHRHALFMCELHLLAYRHHAASDVIVILPQKVDSQHHVVDIVEDKGVLIGVLLLLRQECHGMLTPVAEGVEMVRSVVAIVVAIAVAL